MVILLVLKWNNLCKNSFEMARKLVKWVLYPGYNKYFLGVVNAFFDHFQAKKMDLEIGRKSIFLIGLWFGAMVWRRKIISRQG